MKNTFLFLVFCLVLQSCISTKKTAEVKNTYFKIEIEQDGKIVKEKSDIIILKKKPFKIKLTYYKVNNVYLGSSWGKFYYDFPTNKNIFECDETNYDDCRFFAFKTGAEDRFNEKKDLYVGDRDYMMNWFYREETDWYRMDKGVLVKDGVIYSTVTVENIFDLDKRDAKSPEEEYKYKVEKINQDIYMVFATSHYEQEMEHPEELQREKFILRFK